MKKKLIIAGAAVFLIAAALLFFIPRPLVGEEISITSVNYRMQDVTEQIDLEELGELLAEQETVFSLNAVSSYLIEEYPLEINLVTDRKPLHIVMGKRHYAYEGGLGFDRTIKNGDELYKEISALIK